MRVKLASYNIHKGVGGDGRCDPDRILSVLHELDADAVALQEVDRRFGDRQSVLPRALIEEAHWRIASRPMRPASIGWHGNAILLRPGIELHGVDVIDLPRIEPRGAVCAHLAKERTQFRFAGTHLDLSGLARRRQLRALADFVDRGGVPGILAGDLNDWARRRGPLFRLPGWEVVTPGRSFPARRPLGTLDRFLHDARWHCVSAHVHRSALAAKASDHLPVCAEMELRA